MAAFFVGMFLIWRVFLYIYTFLAFLFFSKVVYVDRMSMECLELLPVWSTVGYLYLGIAHYKAKQF